MSDDAASPIWPARFSMATPIDWASAESSADLDERPLIELAFAA